MKACSRGFRDCGCAQRIRPRITFLGNLAGFPPSAQAVNDGLRLPEHRPATSANGTSLPPAMASLRKSLLLPAAISTGGSQLAQAPSRRAVVGPNSPMPADDGCRAVSWRPRRRSRPAIHSMDPSGQRPSARYETIGSWSISILARSICLPQPLAQVALSSNDSRRR